MTATRRRWLGDLLIAIGMTGAYYFGPAFAEQEALASVGASPGGGVLSIANAYLAAFGAAEVVVVVGLFLAFPSLSGRARGPAI